MKNQRNFRFRNLFWLLAVVSLGLSQHSWFSWAYVAGRIQSHTHNSTTGGGNLSTPNITSYANITASTSVAVSAANRARLMYDSEDNTLKVSEDGAAFRPLRDSSQAQVFTANGTFNVPTGVSLVWVTACAGGGGGGDGAAGRGGGGGGSGEFIYRNSTNVTSGGTLAITIGAGGLNNSNGGDTTSGVILQGGRGGIAGSDTGVGGAGGGGGGGAGGTSGASGGVGSVGAYEIHRGAGSGGGGGSTAGNGGAGARFLHRAGGAGAVGAAPRGGGGAAGFFGTGGGGSDVAGNAAAANTCAGGGAGGASGNGGSGGSGYVIVEWVGP